MGTGAIGEMTLTHCVWSYRGEADYVLLGALDAFLAIGPSFSVGHSCWPEEPERFAMCCDGNQSWRGGFSFGSSCSEGGRTFQSCCTDHAPQDAPARHISSLFDLIPAD